MTFLSKATLLAVLHFKQSISILVLAFMEFAMTFRTGNKHIFRKILLFLKSAFSTNHQTGGKSMVKGNRRFILTLLFLLNHYIRRSIISFLWMNADINHHRFVFETL